ncbi:hypothetical protein TNIN_498021 [Trichonephila inaurata madagascariensis]|uniref:Uncharacterized protein n=1 Tax=Trichonephila inaurata madagascariensis TaxID=2747483 RepID=A0A8X6YB35_9ARAC|nr:hypothetical protein TNIN_498021 [Trichonephila inaurata madagascariensis]
MCNSDSRYSSLQEITIMIPQVSEARKRPSQGVDNYLCILFWNAGGLNNSKFSELKTNILKLDADIIFIVEADASADATFFYQIPDYSLFLIKESGRIASDISVPLRSKALPFMRQIAMTNLKQYA